MVRLRVSSLVGREGWTGQVALRCQPRPGSPLTTSTASWKHLGGAGFTLLELLVSVAIMALLLGMLLPSLSHSRELARRVACAGNLRGLGTALKVYANDCDGAYPIEAMCGNPQTVLTSALHPRYASARGAFYCPNAARIEPYAQSGEYGGPGGDSVVNTDENWARDYITYKYFCVTTRDTRMPLPLRLCEYPHLLRDDSPASRWLMSDWVRQDVPVFPHWDKGGWGGGRNVLFADMSVQFVHQRTPNAFTERQ